jgi:hypothetical protein
VKFKREKRPSIMKAGAEVVYEAEGPEVATPFRIVADSQGIKLVGESPYLEGPADYQALAKAIGDAAKDHLALKPRIERVQ